jgi:NADH dehydrogenase
MTELRLETAMDLLVGATGELGGRVVRRLLERGIKVRVLVRDTSDVGPLKAAGAELAFGDLKELVTVDAACKGIDRIISTATGASRGGEDSVDAVDRQGHATLLRCAENSGVQRFVYVSATGFKTDSPVDLARAKASTAEAIRSSGLNYTILQPALFMESWIAFVIGAQIRSSDTVQVIGDPARRYGFVAVENVADLILGVLEHPDAQRADIPLSAGSCSYQQIVAWAAKATGRDLKVHSLPPSNSIEGFPSIVNDLWSFAATGGMGPLTTPKVAERFGFEMIRPRVFVQNLFGSD